MSKNRIPPSQRPERQRESPGKDVGIGFSPEGGDIRVGVVLRQNGKDTLIAPDEARALAHDMSDGRSRELADKLRDFADCVDTIVTEETAKGYPYATARPAQHGADALVAWVRRHAAVFRAAYRRALSRGFSPDTLVLWAMPHTDSLDDPPAMLDPRTTENVLDLVPESKPGVRSLFGDGFLEELRPGFFRVVASRGEGRFEGTFVGWMPSPGDDETLPPAPMLVGDASLN
jgi:hypothetical protein